MNDDIPEKIGQYEITDVLGSGGMSTVYSGIQSSLNRSVAIKMLPVQLAEDDELIDRFERESSIIAGLNHPNIIQIFDRGTDEGNYYIVMEHVEGYSLDELIHGSQIPIYQIVNIALQVARGLEYAHGKKVVHRDIKPSNILVSSDSGTVKVTDFGIAKLAEEQLSDRMLTREQVAMGTADYMSPEQRRDSRSIDHRTDIFSYGVLLYEMLTKRLPVGRFRDPQELRDDTPPLLNQIVLKCLQEDPEDRYQSFTDVIADLNRLTQKGLAYREALARMSQSVSHIQKKAKTAISSRVTDRNWRKRLGLLGILALSAVVVVFLGSIIIEAFSGGSREPPPAARRGSSSTLFSRADSLLGAEQYNEALEVLRDIRTTAGDAGDQKTAAEAQWRIASIHDQRKSIHYAGIAFGWYSDTFGPGIVGDERAADALYKAGKYKAQDREYEQAIRYLRRLREEYPGYEEAESALLREIQIMHDHLRVSRSERDQHRLNIISRGRSFLERFPQSERCEEVYWRIAGLYQDLGERKHYRRAVDTLEEMGNRFPKSVYLPLFEAAELSRAKLKDKARARRLYEKFLETMPESDRASKARDRLKKL